MGLLAHTPASSLPTDFRLSLVLPVTSGVRSSACLAPLIGGRFWAHFEAGVTLIVHRQHASSTRRSVAASIVRPDTCSLDSTVHEPSSRFCLTPLLAHTTYQKPVCALGKRKDGERHCTADKLTPQATGTPYTEHVHENARLELVSYTVTFRGQTPATPLPTSFARRAFGPIHSEVILSPLPLVVVYILAPALHSSQPTTLLAT